MNGEAMTIDAIVAEVVRRLSHLADAPATPAAAIAPSTVPTTVPSTAPTPQPKTPPAVEQPPAHSSDTLALDARVITTDSVRGRLKGIRTVVVEQRAVVTPSVKDDLQKRHIRLEYREAAQATAGAGELTVVRFARAADAIRAMGTLPLPCGAVERLHEELSVAVDCACESVQNAEQLAVLVTDESLAAACRLNRSVHVRAAQVRKISDVRDAIAAIGANVLVIDPRDMTANQWNVALQEFRKNLPRPCPQSCR